MRSIFRFAFLTVLAAFLAAPFVWMVLVSLHPNRAPIPEPRQIIPAEPAFENYRFVLFHPDLPVLRFLTNSIFVSAAVVAFQIAICSMAAFAFARLEFRHKSQLFMLFLATMMFAGTVTQVPVFLMLRSWGWLDTYLALVVPGASSAYGVFLLRQFFGQIPKELDEAARIDGASDFVVYARVVMPVSKAALATLGAFAFISTWTDFFWPLIATSSQHMRTMETGLSVFKNSYGGTNWPLQMTAAVVTMVPCLIVFLVLQKYFVKGITMGSLK